MTRTETTAPAVHTYAVRAPFGVERTYVEVEGALDFVGVIDTDRGASGLVWTMERLTLREVGIGRRPAAGRSTDELVAALVAEIVRL